MSDEAAMNTLATAQADAAADADFLRMEIDMLRKDVDFLARRAAMAGATSLGREDRDYGRSSNSIVSIAYGLATLEEQKMPGDDSDMGSIERMWAKLPEHRKTLDAEKAIQAARAVKARKYQHWP